MNKNISNYLITFTCFVFFLILFISAAQAQSSNFVTGSGAIDLGDGPLVNPNDFLPSGKSGGDFLNQMSSNGSSDISGVLEGIGGTVNLSQAKTKAGTEKSGAADSAEKNDKFDDNVVKCASSALLQLIEGNLGALVFVAAGIGTLVAVAFGGYRAAISLLMVALSAFVIRSFVILHFGEESIQGTKCDEALGLVSSSSSAAEGAENPAPAPPPSSGEGSPSFPWGGGWVDLF